MRDCQHRSVVSRGQDRALVSAPSKPGDPRGQFSVLSFPVERNSPWPPARAGVCQGRGAPRPGPTPRRCPRASRQPLRPRPSRGPRVRSARSEHRRGDADAGAACRWHLSKRLPFPLGNARPHAARQPPGRRASTGRSRQFCCYGRASPRLHTCRVCCPHGRGRVRAGHRRGPLT